MSETGEKERHGPHPALRMIGVVVLVPAVVALMLTMFAWPAANTEPRDLPIGLVAPPPVAGQVKAQAGDRFEVETYGDEAAARAAISDREVYGAIVIGPQGAKVLTATAASPMVAQLLGQMGTELAAKMPGGGAPPQVVDVVPGSAGDPRGAVLASAVLPLVMAGMVCGLLLFMLTRPGFGQALTLLGVAAGSGLVVVGIAQFWLDALGGDWWKNAGVFGLTILAIGGGVAGLGALLGRAGVGLGAATMMLLGNPLSAITSAPEMLPAWAGTTGQLLPPGAGGSLLRSVAYFSGAGATRPLMVLGIWAGAALLLVIVGRFLPWNRPKDPMDPNDPSASESASAVSAPKSAVA